MKKLSLTLKRKTSAVLYITGTREHQDQMALKTHRRRIWKLCTY
jgi:hypothetical protein